MKERKKKYVALWQVMQRECRRLVSRPLYLFCMVIAPLFCYLFFTTLMDSGLPQNLPAGVVDMDDSSTSRNIVRNLDAFSQTGVVAHYSNVTDARIAVQEGKIYGFFYIPKGLSAEFIPTSLTILCLNKCKTLFLISENYIYCINAATAKHSWLRLLFCLILQRV